jgi:hypothetical protein
LRSCADHELHVLRQLKRLFENQVSFPFFAVLAEQRADAGLDFQPMLDRRHLDRDARPKARFGILHTPFPGRAKLEHCAAMVVVRFLSADDLPGHCQQADNEQGRHYIEQFHRPSPSARG